MKVLRQMGLKPAYSRVGQVSRQPLIGASTKVLKPRPLQALPMQPVRNNTVLQLQMSTF